MVLISDQVMINICVGSSKATTKYVQTFAPENKGNLQDERCQKPQKIQAPLKVPGFVKCCKEDDHTPKIEKSTMMMTMMMMMMMMMS